MKEFTDWKPELTSDRQLLGPYPEVIDFCDGRLPELDFYEESRLSITDDPTVRRIYLPSDAIGINYLVVADLPSLEELVLVGEANDGLESFQWLSISNVPLLKTICLNGGVCSLEIKGATSLSDLDVAGCPNLDHVIVTDAPDTLKVNVIGCLKLRGFIGLPGALEDSSDLENQIKKNQEMSRRDGSLYKCMTFTDIDFVESLINEGVKAMNRAGLLSRESGSLLGKYDLMACDQNFKPYGFQILDPLGPVYTGGTGETYAYKFIMRYVNGDDLEVSEEDGAGNESPEGCLEYMLHWTRMALDRLPSVANSTDQQLLDILKDVVKATPYGVFSKIPIRTSANLESLEVQSLNELATEIGMKVTSEDAENFIYVHSLAGIPKEEEELNWRAEVSLDLVAALVQMARARDWKNR